jgi:crotonobetainyl-CoA:carnitine CoA-transferase CaiB-like acyl-CoA transferase
MDPVVPSESEKPLEGVRVLDLTHAHAGPICTLYMGALGAEVIKVEPPWGEMGRFFPPLVNGVSPYFVFLNRCKKGVTLNLKDPRGKTIFAELVKKVDVVVESFSPGTMEGLGFGWSRLKELNPSVILASLSGFGQTGPWRGWRSFDPIAQAASGLQWLTGGSSQDEAFAPEAVGDTVPGLTMLIGVLSALIHREKTGMGQWVDVAQMDSLIAVMQSFSFWGLAGTTFRDAVGISGYIYGLYKAEDGYVAISVPEGRISDRMKALLEVEELSRKAIREWVSKQTIGEALETLSEVGVPVAPVNDLEQVLSNEQAKARNMFMRITHPQLGEIVQPGFPIKFSKTLADATETSPSLGQHNNEIYQRLLNITMEEIEELRRNGTI